MDNPTPALTPETVIDYVHAFCGRLKGELGPFRLVHAGSALTLLPHVVAGGMRPRVTETPDGFTLHGFMTYDREIHKIEMRITPDGRVTMTNSKPVGTVRFDRS